MAHSSERSNKPLPDLPPLPSDPAPSNLSRSILSPIQLSDQSSVMQANSKSAKDQQERPQSSPTPRADPVDTISSLRLPLHYRVHLANIFQHILSRSLTEKHALALTQSLIDVVDPIWNDLLKVEQHRTTDQVTAQCIIRTIVVKDLDHIEYVPLRIAAAKRRLLQWPSAKDEPLTWTGELHMAGVKVPVASLEIVQNVGRLFIQGLLKMLHEISLEQDLAMDGDTQRRSARRHSIQGPQHASTVRRKKLAAFFGQQTPLRRAHITKPKSMAEMTNAAALADMSTFQRYLYLSRTLSTSFSPRVHYEGSALLQTLAKKEIASKGFPLTPIEKAALHLTDFTLENLLRHQDLMLHYGHLTPSGRLCSGLQQGKLPMQSGLTLSSLVSDFSAARHQFPLSAACDKCQGDADDMVLYLGSRMLRLTHTTLSSTARRQNTNRISLSVHCAICQRQHRQVHLSAISTRMRLGSLLERLAFHDDMNTILPCGHIDVAYLLADDRHQVMLRSMKQDAIIYIDSHVRPQLSQSTTRAPSRLLVSFREHVSAFLTQAAWRDASLKAMMLHFCQDMINQLETEETVAHKIGLPDAIYCKQLEQRIQHFQALAASLITTLKAMPLPSDDSVPRQDLPSWPPFVVPIAPTVSPADSVQHPIQEISAIMQSNLYHAHLHGDAGQPHLGMTCWRSKHETSERHDALHFRFLNDSGRRCEVTLYAAQSFARLRQSADNKANAAFDAFAHSLSTLKDWSPSGGKSQASFLTTLDEKYVIKTLPPNSAEKGSLLHFLPAYFEHLEKHPRSLLSKIVGLYSVVLDDSAEKVFVVMDRLMVEHEALRFDLKGIPDRSSTKRQLSRALSIDAFFKSSAKKADQSILHATTTAATLWDREWLDAGREGMPDQGLLLFQPDLLAVLFQSLSEDVALLQRCNMTDYSLLVIIGEENKQKVCRLAIVDYACPYNLMKMLEHQGKSQLTQHHKVTVQPPDKYGERFLDGLQSSFMGPPLIASSKHEKSANVASARAMEEI